MNKLAKNLFLGLVFSLSIGVINAILTNQMEYNPYSLGVVFGGGLVIFLTALALSVIISFILKLFKKSFWSVILPVFWIIAITISFFALFGTYLNYSNG